MTDSHVHIGQYYNNYYDFRDVFKVIKNNGINEIICAYFLPRFLEKEPAIEFYEAVVEELIEAEVFSQRIGLNVRFLYWCDPFVIKEITLKKIFKKFHYYGIALHPKLHNWTGELQDQLLNIFEFCNEKKIPIYIHTGIEKIDEPMQFEPYISKFPKVEIHLAHCKDYSSIIKLFKKYPNLLGDTAFCPKQAYEEICKNGFKNRMLFGTDFPLTHWFHKGECLDNEINFENLQTEYQLAIKENCGSPKLS